MILKAFLVLVAAMSVSTVHASERPRESQGPNKCETYEPDCERGNDEDEDSRGGGSDDRDDGGYNFL